MTKMDDGECAKLFNQSCQQKVDCIIPEVEELIDKSTGGNSEMQTAIKCSLADELLEGTGFHIVRDGASEATIFEMASAVLPNGTEIDLWQAIFDGEKMIDVRARTPKYQTVKIDDTVIFRRMRDGRVVMRKVVMISEIAWRSFPCVFSDLILEIVKDYGIMPEGGFSSVEVVCSLIVPGIKTISELAYVISGFNKEEKLKNGLIAFALQPLTAKEIEDYLAEHCGWQRKTTEGKTFLTRSVPQY